MKLWTSCVCLGATLWIAGCNNSAPAPAVAPPTTVAKTPGKAVEESAKQPELAEKPVVKAPPKQVELTDEQKQAIDDLKKLGGTIKTDASGNVVGIDLRDHAVKDDQLAPVLQFPNLKSLVIWGPDIHDAALDTVCQLTHLQELEIENCPAVDDAGVEKLKTLVDLKSINLRRSGISDEAMKTLREMPKLQQLHLLYTRLSDQGLVELKDMTRVTLLDLRGCAYITDSGIENLEGLTNLQTLKLRNFGVTNAG
ncbi:MAG TPA: hypothetical protein VHB77_07555, partial [Planctomycetaceae bacterium]|nr:hypothetical protein [Planctomycetaceae bacterium]